MSTQHGLSLVAQKMVADKKSIVAADESPDTMKKRFESAGLQYSEEAAHRFRTALFTTPGIEKYVSAVILHKDTLTRYIDSELTAYFLQGLGIIPGVKVDQGLRDLPGHPGEKYTLGLDSLTPQSLQWYIDAGAHFAKARSVYRIGASTSHRRDGSPSSTSYHENAHFQAMYAYLCQQAGIVPIVEPEVLIDGEHDIETCFAVSKHALTVLVNTLLYYGVDFESMILKPSMVTRGLHSNQNQSPEHIAQLTLRALKECGLPQNVPGIAFLSGGHSPFRAREYLAYINRRVVEWPQLYRWKMTGSFGRASQADALKVWALTDGDIKKTQEVFMWVLERISKARDGFILD